MNPDARRENTRRLAALLGTSDEVAEAKLDRTIVVTAQSTPEATAAAEILTNLLARTFSTVSRECRAEAAAEVVVGSVRAVTGAPIVRVSFGTNRVIIGGASIPDSDSSPIVPRILLALAATYAAGAAVRVALAEDAARLPAASAITLDLDQLLGSDAASVQEPFDFGSVFLAGAGAVAHGFVLGLMQLASRGTLHVADPDVAKGGNLNRCYFFTESDIGANKAERLCENAAKAAPGISFVPHSKRLASAVSDTGLALERLVSTVDSRRARRDLQDEIPREVFDASTTGIEEVVLHFNDIRCDGVCMSCVYHRERNEAAREEHIAAGLGVPIEKVRENWIDEQAAQVIAARHPDLSAAAIAGEAYDSLFKERCGQGRLLGGGDEDVLAPFAFVSAMAGIYLALEFGRRIRNADTVRPFNYWRASPWLPPVLRLRQSLPARADCVFCGNPTRWRVARGLWTPA
jgi:hypothetical protein